MIRLVCLLALGLLVLQGSARADAGAKPPLVGLISMGRTGFSSFNDNAARGGIPGSRLDDVTAKRNAFDGTVINVPWSVLQPVGPQDLDTGYIDRILAGIRDYNRDPRTSRTLRAVLRVWAGANAPDWAKNLGGGAIQVWRSSARERGELSVMGRFWSQEYGDAFRNLQAKLAAKYDSEPLIAQVSNTSCTSEDDEPHSVPRYQDRRAGISSIVVLHRSGYSDDAQRACLKRSILDYAGWRKTNLDFVLGPFLSTDNAEFRHIARDRDFPLSLMRLWRDAYGARAVLDNHNLRYPPPKDFLPFYAAMQKMGGQISFQTHSARGLDWDRTVELAVCLGGQSLELWNETAAGGYANFPTATLETWSGEIRSHKPSALCDQFR